MKACRGMGAMNPSKMPKAKVVVRKDNPNDVDEKEPITDGAPIIFTDAKDGVRPEFNPRTDRWEIAIDAMDKVSN